MSNVAILAVLSDGLVISEGFKGSICQWQYGRLFKVINSVSKNNHNCLTTGVWGTMGEMFHFLWK